jgi:hypothetical protein
LGNNSTDENINFAVQAYVDSLWSVIPCFRCWDAYVEMLVPEDPQAAEYLSDVEFSNSQLGSPESLLLRVLLCAVNKLNDELKSLQNNKLAKQKKV